MVNELDKSILTSPNSRLFPLIIAVIVTIASSGCQMNFGEKSNLSSLTAQDEIAIYRLIASEEPDPQVFALYRQRETIADMYGLDAELFIDFVPGFKKETWDSFITKNRLSPGIPKQKKSIPFKLRLERKNEQDAPHHLVSRIGFSSTRQQAFLEYTRVCGAFCAKGWFVFLKKIDGKWRIQTKKSTTEDWY